MTEPKIKQAVGAVAAALGAAPKKYNVGLEGNPFTECVVGQPVYDQIDDSFCTLADGYAVLANGTRIIDMVFEINGFHSYLERARAGEITLGCLDGNPLNCTLGNITVNNVIK